MTHCPSCGKEVIKPSRVLKNYCFTIEAYDCRKCHHNFRVTVNESNYLHNSNIDYKPKLCS